jgi:pilus assembly protein CpaD
MDRIKGHACHAVALMAVLLAGSCAAPVNDGTVVADGLANHPITVAPSYRSLELAFSTPSAGLAPADENQLEAFTNDYLARGDGAVSISAPEGPRASEELAFFGDRLVQLGVPRSRILVGTHDVGSTDGRVELGYVLYAANTAPCGDWSENAADTSANLPRPDFGCSVQHNIAAMVADPRDLVAPRGMGAGDATRRETVIGNYEKAQTTGSQKSSDQSGKVSDVGSQ